jgi:hypothetical protein
VRYLRFFLLSETHTPKKGHIEEDHNEISMI